MGDTLEKKGFLWENGSRSLENPGPFGRKMKEKKKTVREAPFDFGLHREELLRATLESIDDGLLVVSKGGTIFYHNTRFLEIWGIPPVMAETRRENLLLEYVQPQFEFPKEFLADVSRVCASPEKTPEVRKLKDGRSIELFSTPLQAWGGEETRLWLFRDVTGRVRAAAALRDREAQLSSIFRALPTLVALVGNRMILDVNEAVTGITGYSREEVIGKPTRFLYPTQEDYEALSRIYPPLQAGEPTVGVETRWRRKDGSVIDVSLKVAPLDIQDPGKGFTVSGTDITEKKLATKALEANQALLKESQRIGQIGSWVIDIPSGKLTWSEESFRVVGREPFSFEPSLQQLLEWVCPEDRPRLSAHFEDCLAGKPLDPFEVRISWPDGSIHWVHVTGVMKCDESGRPVRFIGTQQDFTERKRSEEARLELERHLLHAQKLESLGLMAGGIAHDFNNLLMAILGNLDLALFHCPKDSPVHLNIQQSRSAAQRAADLTRQLLAFTGKTGFNPGEIDLSGLVEENAHLLRTCISRLVILDLELDPGLPRFLGDSGQIQQVIMNLITNASESYGENPGTIFLKTGMQQCDGETLRKSRVEEVPPPGTFVFLEIADSGCGMDGETQERMFDPFFTTKFLGRGLGMSAILGIIRTHKGAIFVDSKDGRGTTVRVLFSAGEAPPMETQFREKPSASGGAIVNEDALEGAVLVVDDEEMVRVVSVRILEKFGWRVVSASDGPEALDLLLGGTPAIICVILDLSMPLMDGRAVFREMHALKPDLPIILSSGYSSDKDSVQKMLGEGLAGFIQKPFDAGELDREVKRVLGLK